MDDLHRRAVFAGATVEMPVHETELLDDLRALRDRARADRPGYAFPLFLFGVLVLAAPMLCAPAAAARRRAGRLRLPPRGPRVVPQFVPLAGGFAQPDLIGWYWVLTIVGGGGAHRVVVPAAGQAPRRGDRHPVPVRGRGLGILTIAAESRRVEFGYLKDTLELTGGNLSRHLTVLVDVGLLDMEKGYDGRRPKTWVSITRAGRQALAEEIAALRARGQARLTGSQGGRSPRARRECG